MEHLILFMVHLILVLLSFFVLFCVTCFDVNIILFILKKVKDINNYFDENPSLIHRMIIRIYRRIRG